MNKRHFPQLGRVFRFGTMEGIKLRVGFFFFATSCICLWLDVKYSAAQCPSATLLPSDVLPSIADNEVTEHLKEQIASLKERVPALFQTQQIDVYSVAVVYRNSTIFSTGMVNTPFRIASVTKIFTAMGALVLRQRGRLSLDDPVKKLLPSFSVINPYGEHDITLRELMGHLSGLPRELCVGSVCESEDEEENLRSIAKMQLVRPPWSFLPTYSNLGFIILGHAWEKATSPRQTWSDFVRDEILTPLKMHKTGANVNLTNVDLAPGHIGNYSSKTSLGWLGPAGEMYSTAHDLAKFLKFLLNPNPPLLTATAIREWTHPTTIFTTGTTSGYALPWELREFTTSDNASTTLITKGGDIGSYHSVIAFHPTSQLGIAVLTSADNATSESVWATVMAPILRDLIPEVESIHSKIVSRIFAGDYLCKRSAAAMASVNAENATFRVIGGAISVAAMKPGKAMVVSWNVSVVENGVAGRITGNGSLVMRLGREFFEYPALSCIAISGLLSFDPEIARPNFPESVYFWELVFEPEKKKVSWPGIGAECYM